MVPHHLSCQNPGYTTQAHSDCKYQCPHVSLLQIKIIYILFYASSQLNWTKCTFIVYTFSPLYYFSVPDSQGLSLGLRREIMFQHLFYLLLKYAMLRKKQVMSEK